MKNDIRIFAFVLALVLGQAVIHPMMYGPLAALYSELFSTGSRYTGASLGYQLAGLGAGLAAGAAGAGRARPRGGRGRTGRRWARPHRPPAGAGEPITGPQAASSSRRRPARCWRVRSVAAMPSRTGGPARLRIPSRSSGRQCPPPAAARRRTACTDRVSVSTSRARPATRRWTFRRGLRWPRVPLPTNDYRLPRSGSGPGNPHRPSPGSLGRSWGDSSKQRRGDGGDD